MKLTFLGHQGWMIESSDHCLLVDPILTPYFRNSAHSRVWMFPPRALDLTRLGRLDAVYFTHEHEDHFHVESVHRLPRSVTIYLSGNMSISAERIVRQMGFSSVHRLFAADRVKFGKDLEMTLYAPAGAPSERWVLQPFVKGSSFRDSFFNAVDCPISAEFSQMLKTAKAAELGLVCVANNQQAPRVAGDPNAFDPVPPSAGAIFEPARMLSIHQPLGHLPRMRALAIVGGGFIDETAPFGTYRCAPQRRLAEVLQEYSHGGVAIVGPEPGEWMDLGEEPLALHRPDPLGVVAASPEGEAALRRAEARAKVYDPRDDYEPVTGRRALDDAALIGLENALGALSARLAMHPMQAEMVQQGHSKTTDGSLVPYGEGRLLLLLRQGDGRIAYEYRPSHCAFVRLPRPPATSPKCLYPFGMECWASDLFALMSGELCVYELIKHKNRGWSPPQHYLGRFTVSGLLDDLFAPEVAPDVTYALYRSALDRCREPASAS